MAHFYHFTLCAPDYTEHEEYSMKLVVSEALGESIMQILEDFNDAKYNIDEDRYEFSSRANILKALGEIFKPYK